MSNRSGEDDKTHFRGRRFEQVNGLWFYLTREGTQHGPYADREEAERELLFYLRKIGVFEVPPGADDPDGVDEANRKYGAVEDKYDGS